MRRLCGKRPEDLVLFQAVGHRHLHGAVERQFAAVHAVEHLDRDLDHVVAFQQLAAEAGPGDLDLAWPGRFPAAG